MDRYPIRVTLLANAGELIRYQDTALLLDGLFGRKDNPFSLLPPGCRVRTRFGRAFQLFR